MLLIIALYDVGWLRHIRSKAAPYSVLMSPLQISWDVYG